ncbi:MAG: DUF3810 domain-containing protein [Sphingobacteriales bacterium]|nr:DUF3810 domain-containing protein [Sphingobacteriales bacterium]
MITSKRWAITAGTLLIPTIAIKLFANHADWVENYYSNGIYRYISLTLRYTTGWLPVSFGDILYLMIFIWILLKITRSIQLLVKNELSFFILKLQLQRLILFILSIYIVFNLFWGLNYNRKGIGFQLGLAKERYTKEELKTITALLLKKVNESKTVLISGNAEFNNYKDSISLNQNPYIEIARQFPFLTYDPVIVKPSLWAWAANYLGIYGYYNPFTGEAQVNTKTLFFLQPYTTSHEIAHQLGYAKEDEANFVGYLAASTSSDPLLHYSVYLDLFNYSLHQLRLTDSVTAQLYATQLLPEVKKDILAWRQFNYNHKNPVEPIISWIYGKYLENNQQPAGVLSYDEVTGLLIAYYKKFGRV